jgi:hypothetical protein
VISILQSLLNNFWGFDTALWSLILKVFFFFCEVDVLFFMNSRVQNKEFLVLCIYIGLPKLNILYVDSLE